MKILGLLFGVGVAALGLVLCETTSARVLWAVAAILITLLLLVVRHGQARVPILRFGISLVLIVTSFVATMLSDKSPQLGLDLQGGVSIVLFPVEGSELSQLNTAVDVISSRVAGLGVAEPEVSRQGNTIVVDIPGLKDPQRAVEVVGRTACLRFRLVTAGPVPANAVTEATTTTASTTSTTIAGTTSTTVAGSTTAVGTTTLAPAPSTTPADADASGVTIDTRVVVAARPAQSRPAQSPTTTIAGTTSGAPGSTAPSTTVSGATTTTVPAAPKLNCDAAASTGLPPDLSIPDSIPTDGGTQIVPPDSTSAPIAADEPDAEAGGASIDTVPVAAARPAQTAPATTVAPTSTVPTSTAPGSTTSGPSTTGATTTTLPVGTNICETLVTEDDPEGSSWVYDNKAENCYQVGPTILTGRAISDADSRFEQNGFLVDVTFKNDDFVNLVANPNVGQRVAIVLDDRVQSAPTINEGITGRDVVITGDFDEQEAADLALVLRYGSLPIQFDESETTQQTVSASLGKDQLRAGIAAGLFGLALVALYMLFFYRLLGLVVWFGLALTAMIFLSLVTFLGNSESFGLSLTLSGVTGLIVSVGVTVDSYVVYFERLKDEVRAGKTIRSSLDSGFTRAFRTIVAADLVSLIGAGVLYALAVGSVRGFAFFLGLSTLIDLVIAYFVMYPLVWFMARRPKLVRMKGLGIAAGLDVAGKVDV